MKKILLCCGAGMSSGFIAQKMRKAAKKNSIMVEIDAITESDVDSYINMIDLLLVGPHMTYVFNELKKKTEEANIPMMIIPEEIYGTLDGERLLEISLQELNK